MINIPVFTGFIYARWLGMGYLNHQPYEKKTTSPKKGVERMDLHWARGCSNSFAPMWQVPTIGLTCTEGISTCLSWGTPEVMEVATPPPEKKKKRMARYMESKNEIVSSSSWWFQPIWKICSSKNIWNHQPFMFSGGFFGILRCSNTPPKNNEHGNWKSSEEDFSFVKNRWFSGLMLIFKGVPTGKLTWRLLEHPPFR